MLILVALLDKKLRATIAFALESEFNVRVLEACSLGEAADYLLKKPFDLLICEHPLIFESLNRIFISKGNGVPTIVYSPEEGAQAPHGDHVLGCVSGRSVLSDITKAVTEFRIKSRSKDAPPVPPGSLEPEEVGDDEFCRIHVELLYGVNPLRADVYIKLGPKKYVRLFTKGDPFDTQDRLKVLAAKNIDYLYVKKGESAALLNKLQSDLVHQMETQPFRKAAAEKLALDIQQAASSLISRIGATDEVRELVKSNVLLTVKFMGQSPKMKNIISKIIQDKTQYISAHSIFLAQLSCSIAATMDWGSKTTFHKLTLAAFLHDIALTDQNIAMIQTKTELDWKAEAFGYSPELQTEFLMHTYRAQQLALSFKELPPDVDAIIAQHHEQPDGTGFPRGLNHKRIAPLSAVLIVAHDLLHMIYEQGLHFQMSGYLEQRREKYNCGVFAKIYHKLKHIKF